jgi:hypothetical protein
MIAGRHREDAMTGDEIKSPKFLSWEFHARFFPQLLSSRLRPKKTQRTGFVHSGIMEGMILMAVCGMLLAYGLPNVLKNGSIAGWIATVLGGGGIIALFIASAYLQRGIKPSYDHFLFGIFFFFVTLGTLGGGIVGLYLHSQWIEVAAGAAGFCIGYLVGILTGQAFQYLGVISGVVDALAYFGTVVAAGTAIIMLFIK